MSNPVAPPPPANEGGYPPPADQGFGAAPTGQPYPGQPHPGQPYPGQPYPGQPYPGQPYPDQPQQGFGDAPGSVPAQPKKKSAAGRIILRIALAVVVAVIGVVVKTTIFGDKASNAAVGDCIAASKDVKANEETDADAKVVDCTSSEAAFTVVGRVDGETDTKSKSCDRYFQENEQFFVYSSDAGKGYLLCLKPKA